MNETFKFKFLLSRSEARENCREMRHHIGQYIAETRSSQGLSLLDMSDALRLPVTLLDDIEAGFGNIKIEHILYICRFLGLRIHITLCPRVGLDKTCRREEIEAARLFRAEQKERLKQEQGDCYID